VAGGSEAIPDGALDGDGLGTTKGFAWSATLAVNAPTTTSTTATTADCRPVGRLENAFPTMSLLSAARQPRAAERRHQGRSAASNVTRAPTE
jgi:hypothetical protein